jgi:P-type Ca2+ transporter type 2C
MNWHRLKREDIFELTGSGPDGLTEAEAAKNLLRYGYNQLEEGKKKTVAVILLSQFKDVMIIILLIAAAVSGFIGDLKDTIVILIIVVLNAVIGFFQEYRAEKAMQELKKMASTQTKVIRDGVPRHLNA